MNRGTSALRRAGVVLVVGFAALGPITAATAAASSDSGSPSASGSSGRSASASSSQGSDAQRPDVANAAVPLLNDQLVVANLDTSGLPTKAQLINRLVSTNLPKQQINPTTATNDVRYVDRGGAPKLQGTGILVEVGGPGTQMVTTQATFGEPLPVALHAEYVRGGQAVDPSTVTGASGTVTIKYTATNTVVKKEQISYKNAAGKKTTTEEPVFAPFAGALRVTIPSGAKLIDAPDAVSNTSADGKTELLWNLLLSPPMGSYQQTVQLTMSADPIQLPALTMEVTPVTSKQDPAGGFASGMIDKSVSGNTEMVDGLTTLDSSAAKLASGAAKLASGLNQLSTGTKELASGEKQLATGATKADSGSATLTTYSKQLSSGLVTLAAGLNDMAGASGLPAAVAATGKLVTAVNEIATGVGPVSDCVVHWPPPTPFPKTISLMKAVCLVEAGSEFLYTAENDVIKLMRATADTIKGSGSTLDTDSIFIKASTAGTKAQAAYDVLCTVPSTAGCADLQDSITAANQAAAGATAARAALMFEVGLQTAIAAGINAMTDGLQGIIGTSSTPGLKAVSAGLKSGDPNNPGVYEGLVQLQAGLVTANAAAQKLSNGADAAETGSKQITSGQVELTSGLDALKIGTVKSAAGAATLNTSTQEAATGGAQLASGASDLQTAGTSQILAKVVDASTEPALAQAYFAAATKMADAATPYVPPNNAAGRVAYVYSMTPPEPHSAVDWPVVILCLFTVVALGILTSVRIRRPVPAPVPTYSPPAPPSV